MCVKGLGHMRGFLSDVSAVKEYGHVAAVCKGVGRCGRCWKDSCHVEEFKGEEEQAKCLHFKGNHHTGSARELI